MVFPRSSIQLRASYAGQKSPRFHWFTTVPACRCPRAARNASRTSASAGSPSPEFVDWNCAARGNAAVARAFFAPSLRLEGGPLPEEVILGQAALAACPAGFFAARAGLAPIPDAGRASDSAASSAYRAALGRAGARPAAPRRALGEAPAGSRGDALAAGEIDVAGWNVELEQLIGDTYTGRS